MMIIIAYDVNTTSAAGRKRLNKISKICCNYGQRVQNSVFECDVDYAKYIFIKNELLKTYNSHEDSIRMYNLGNNYINKIEHYGTKYAYDPEGLLML